MLSWQVSILTAVSLDAAAIEKLPLGTIANTSKHMEMLRQNIIQDTNLISAEDRSAFPSIFKDYLAAYDSSVDKNLCENFYKKRPELNFTGIIFLQ